MDSSLASSNPAPAPANDRLITTLFLAALFHGIIILGVSFGSPASSDADAAPTLEVLLVDTRLPEARTNEDASYLAQRTQQGSGNTTKTTRTSSPAASALPLDTPGIPEGQGLESHESGRESPDAPPLTTTGFASRVVRVADAAETADGPAQTALLMRSGPVSALPASDDDGSLALKGQRQDELLITPSTRESDVAVYLDAWKRKVERMGTLHFPSEARRRNLSGSPVLEVAIRADGMLEDMQIQRSSGHAELDQAALAILKLASPFDPFPAALRSRHRIVRFAYEWQFVQGQWINSSMQAPAAP